MSYASRLHREQARKGTDIPYVAHLLGVASIALQNGADEDQAIAALLHDAIEDQDVTAADIERRFGSRVAMMVDHCTDSQGPTKPEWRARKEAYVASLATKPVDSLMVSLADKTHNARAIVDDLAVEGDTLWSRFTGGREGSLWYYGALADAFEARVPGPASARFTALVAEMRGKA